MCASPSRQHGKVLLVGLLMFGSVVNSSDQGPDVVITNIMDEDAESFVPWDKVMDRPVQFWKGDYGDVDTISCKRPDDLLFDWLAVKRGMAGWLRELQQGTNRVMQSYWEEVRPIQHALTNIVAFHNTTTSRDCMLGMLAVRLFYLTVQSLPYREHEIIVQNNFVIDWYYYIHRFSWENLVRSGWGSVIWPSMDVLSGSFKQTNEWLVWVDCERLPGGLELPATIEEAVAALASDEVMSTLMNAVDDTDKAVDGSCPVSKAYAAILVAFGLQGDQSALKYLNRAQAFLRQYREKNDFTLVNLMHFQWPMWQVLSLTVNRLAEEQEDSPFTAKSCDLQYCPEGGTPNPVTCECEVIFPVEHRNTSICFFFVDTRRKSSLRNITSILNARFWTLTYGITRAYADEHGYEVEYVQPDNQTHFPERKVGWGKVKVIIDKLREYGPERCSFGVSIDTDAYMRTSEPLAAVIHHYGLDADKLILFSQEYHTENRPDNTFANGGFFIVRNSPEGVGLLEEWYKVPETYPEMYHLKKENPQGLNLCWDLKMQPRHSDVVVLAPPHLFTAPLGWYVRHNWFKDLRFEQEMQDVLLQRLQRRYGCIVCQNVFDWDDSLNTDVGWR